MMRILIDGYSVILFIMTLLLMANLMMEIFNLTAYLLNDFEDLVNMMPNLVEELERVSSIGVKWDLKIRIIKIHPKCRSMTQRKI